MIIFFKNSLSLLYFLLTLYSTFAQLFSTVEQICLLKILLYSTLRISVFTHTLGKIYFLLCFACSLFLCSMDPLWFGPLPSLDILKHTCQNPTKKPANIPHCGPTGQLKLPAGQLKNRKLSRQTEINVTCGPTESDRKKLRYSREPTGMTYGSTEKPEKSK